MWQWIHFIQKQQWSLAIVQTVFSSLRCTCVHSAPRILHLVVHVKRSVQVSVNSLFDCMDWTRARRWPRLMKACTETRGDDPGKGGNGVMGGGRKQRQEEKETGGRGNRTQERGSIVFFRIQARNSFGFCEGWRAAHGFIRERTKDNKIIKYLNWAIC